MTLKVSTRFKELILGANAFADIFDGGRILLYSGVQPASADLPPAGTLLAQITRNGDTWVAGGSAGGLSFEQFGALVGKPTGEAWRLVASGAGTPGWFRLVAGAADPGELSFSHARIDGSVGTSSAHDLRLTAAALAAGQNLPVQQFLYTLPPIGVTP